jgi:hypothetical protein
MRSQVAETAAPAWRARRSKHRSYRRVAFWRKPNRPAFGLSSRSERRLVGEVGYVPIYEIE